jgi:lipopolysaccharide/colanic/teichoic acid biosynthesis glycosyltransferase
MDKSVKVVKRLMDILGSGVGLAITLPAFPFIALAIYVDSPGPIFLRQIRAGKLVDGEGEGEKEGELAEGDEPEFETFEMYKFRSMIPNAEKFTGQVLASKDDPRITRIGKILRKTRLDELPQLWNVLRGDMSLVGPRPERPERQVNLALAIPFFEERMRDVKPGITGLAQTSLSYTGRATDDSAIKAFEEMLTNPFDLDIGANEGEDADSAIPEADDMRMKLLFDLPYVAALERLPSFLRMDLGIIFRTPLVMLQPLLGKKSLGR